MRQAQRLDHIASTTTRSPRPDTSSTTFQEAKEANKGVLKRSFSDRSSHVYILSLPDGKSKLTEDISKPSARFILQTYIPTLISYGELRVAVSYGRVIWRVLTKTKENGDTEFLDVDSIGKILNVPMGYGSSLNLAFGDLTLS